MSWDDTKAPGLKLTSSEWNNHVADQKSRAKVEYGSGAPTSTPSMIGAIYIDSDTGDKYVAVGTSSSADWQKVVDQTALDSVSTDLTNHTSDSTIHFTQSEISISANQINDLASSDITVNSLVSNNSITYDEEVVATSTIDWTQGNKQSITLTADTTLTFIDPSGPCNLILKIVQDNTGGWNITFPSNVKFENGVTVDLSSDPGNSVRIVSMYFDGTNYYAQITDAY